MNRRAIVLLVAAVLLAPAPAVAGPVTFDFAGVLTGWIGFPGFAAGDRFTGSFTFDSDLVNQSSEPDRGMYYPAPGVAPFAMTLTNSAQQTMAFNVFMDLIVVWAGYDGYTGFGVGCYGPGIEFGNLQVVSQNPAVPLVTSVNLPTSAPDLAAAQYAGIFFRAAGTNFHGDLTSLAVVPNAPIPEPASLVLLGTGLIGLRAWRKRAG